VKTQRQHIYETEEKAKGINASASAQNLVSSMAKACGSEKLGRHAAKKADGGGLGSLA
jgi:hypothetical protein